MSNYVLDTDTCIYWLKGMSKIRDKIEQVGTRNLRMTIITLAELRYGAYNSKKIAENLQSLHNFLRKIRILSLNEDSTDRFGRIKAKLRSKGQMIDDFDCVNCSIK